MDIIIRQERPQEWRQVEALTREAFWNTFVPGCDEHYLAHILRDASAFIPELDLVAEIDGQLVGNIMYTKGWIEDAQGAKHDVILFGPLSVLPAYQGRGVGGVLIRHSAAEATRLGHRAILIYGDPQYYSRFGFRPASEFGILTPDGKTHPAMQALALYEGALDGITGRFFEDPIYETIDAAKVEAFDKSFPPKEKAVTESQKRFAALADSAE